MDSVVSGSDFDLHGPDWAKDPERSLYSVGWIEPRGGNDDLFWSSDHSLITDSFGIALAWAQALQSAAEDGENPMPVARVVAHRTHPASIEVPPEGGPVDESEERAIAFVTHDGVLSAAEEQGRELEEETSQFSEIIKIVGDSED